MTRNHFICNMIDVLSIDRFHSRDRWPQWGGETIRNILIRKS